MDSNLFNNGGSFTSAQNKITNLISVKLEDKNFKQWRQQVSGVIRAFDLQKYITDPSIPEKFLTDEDRTAGIVNPLHQDWEKHDASDEIQRHFHTLLITKARQLRSELRTLSKGDRTIEEFIQCVRVINESLISIDDPIPQRNLIEIVLDALPEDYDPVVAAINKNSTQHSASYPNFPSGSSHVNAQENQGSFEYNRGGGRSGRGGGRSGRGGRGGKSGVTCQICHKPNHDASICHYRHSGAMNGYQYRAPQPQFYPPLFNPYGYGGNPRSQRPPQALLTGGNSTFNNQWWYPDSGASHHVTPDPSNLSDVVSLHGSDQVLMGNGQGKSHRIHAPASNTTYSSPLELVVCDLRGPTPVKSSSGFTYFLTCVDAFSRFVWVYHLKLKSDTLSRFIQFKSMVELQFNCKIKQVQTNGGGEFRPLTQHLANLGIIHRLTCPHTHHQNSLVERKHRHLVETGLTLLSKASIPMKYWDMPSSQLPFLSIDSPSLCFKINHHIMSYSTNNLITKPLKYLAVHAFRFLDLITQLN
ncbi:unnamed protein product [Trifolium pratense]|uniref:Uncharacterized protein n=1 Tax=Trifolium pratense TaxID=57577 RepID=A0ACB0I7C2_TRIPR|nr:unnamed protein product [Trifolium pratense]